MTVFAGGSVALEFFSLFGGSLFVAIGAAAAGTAIALYPTHGRHLSEKAIPSTTHPLRSRRQPPIGSPGLGRSELDSSRRHVDDPLLAEVWRLLKRGQPDKALELLQDVRCAGGKGAVASSCYRALFQKLACDKAPQELFGRLVEELCHAQVPSDRVTEACIVRYFCRGPGADLDIALESYQASLAAGVTPDLCTVECLAAAAIRHERPAAVCQLVAGLDRFRLRPTVPLLASLIAACSSLDDQDGLAVAIGGLRVEASAGCCDNATRSSLCHGYAAAVCAVSRCANGVAEAAALFVEGREAHGLELGPAPMAALLAAAARAGHDALAMRLAAQARLDGVAGWPDGPVAQVAQLLGTQPELESMMQQVCKLLADASDAPLVSPLCAALPT